MNTFVGFEKEEIEKSISDRFEKIVSLYPQQIAIKTESQTITYEALNKKANQLARLILAKNGLEAESIIILIENEIDILTSIFAILKAGKFYTILAPSFPQERLKLIKEETQAKLIVTNSQNLILAKELAQNNLRIINVDSLDFNVNDDNLRLSIFPESIANIVFTSGSTGKPKGVIASHRFLLHRVYKSTNNDKIEVGENYSTVFNFSFSGWFSGVLTYLLNGASLVSYNFIKLANFPLKDWLKEKKINRFSCTSEVFYQFVDSLAQTTYFPSLRQINIVGDKLYKKEVERFWQRVSGNCILLHPYGSSETIGIAENYLKRDSFISSNIVPAGYPVLNKEIKILDEQGKELGFNEVGEIAVKSRYLSPGYWRNPPLTQEKFLPDPDGSDARIYLTGDLGRLNPDGCLELLGRKDFMVKIRGFRVELGEIEVNLMEHPHIERTLVIAKGDKSEDQKIIAYFIPTDKSNIHPRQLREFLFQKLPDYMIPSAFVPLTSFPLTLNGKVDIKALPEVDFDAHREKEFIAPRNETEIKLAQIWQEVLGIENIGINDNFFDLGGQSLLATQVISRIRQTFKVELPLLSLFEVPTVTEIGSRIENILWITPVHKDYTDEKMDDYEEGEL